MTAKNYRHRLTCVKDISEDKVVIFGNTYRLQQQDHSVWALYLT